MDISEIIPPENFTIDSTVVFDLLVRYKKEDLNKLVTEALALAEKDKILRREDGKITILSDEELKLRAEHPDLYNLPKE